MHGKVIDLLKRNPGDIEFEDLSWFFPDINSIYDNDLLWSFLAKNDIKQDVSHTDSRIDDGDTIRKRIIFIQIFDDGWAKTVVPKKPVSTSENEHGFRAILRTPFFHVQIFLVTSCQLSAMETRDSKSYQFCSSFYQRFRFLPGESRPYCASNRRGRDRRRESPSQLCSGFLRHISHLLSGTSPFV